MLAASDLSPFSGLKTSVAASRALSVLVPPETLSGISEIVRWVASGDWHWGESNVHSTVGCLAKVITLKCVSGSNWWMNWIKKVFTRTKFWIPTLLDASTMRHTSSFFSSHGDGTDKKYIAHFMKCKLPGKLWKLERRCNKEEYFRLNNNLTAKCSITNLSNSR